MKENKELERNDLAVDRDMQIDADVGQEILAYLETWFDVDKKFGVHTADNDSTWLNMYAIAVAGRLLSSRREEKYNERTTF